MSKNLENKIKSCITDDEVELFSGAPLITDITDNSNNLENVVTEKLDINSVKWGMWTEDLEKQLDLDKTLIESHEEADTLWEYVEKTINKITEKHSTMKKSTKHSKPFWTNKLTLLCEKMRAARKSYKKRNTDPNKQKMIETKEEFDAERKAECEKFILGKTRNLNATEAGKFWKEFNKIFKKTSEGGIDPLEDGNGGLIKRNC